jgi:hypothetical protein
MVLNFGPMPKKGWDMMDDASRSMHMGKWATRPIFAPSNLHPQLEVVVVRILVRYRTSAKGNAVIQCGGRGNPRRSGTQGQMRIL